LTGGATPMGERVLSTARLDRIESIGAGEVRVQAGVPIETLERALEAAGRHYPPIPTFAGAFVGGTVATNAAGAATFKHGTTRDWVRALTLVLPGGEVIDLERGRTQADESGRFEIELADRMVRFEIPGYRMPRVPKLSAGYFAAPGMDLVDLIVGSEGTLGIVTAVTLKVLPVRPAICLAFVSFPKRNAALTFVKRLRDAALETWRTEDPRGLDVAAIEQIDRRCLTLIREDGEDRKNGVEIPDETEMALLVEIELPEGTSPEQAFDAIGRARSQDTPLARFCRMLEEEGVLDSVQIAVPGDRARAAQLRGVREAVPAAVNRRVGRAQHDVDARINKTAADMIVPFDRVGALLDFYDAEFGRRGLDAAVWGHVSDGNVHPNVIPRSFAEVESGRQAILAFGREVLRLGGAPLAEHGVGRNPIKQELLRMMYGDEGIEAMRRIKRAIDPEWKLSPGVLFPRQV
jgi:D-lactate dehydrogenase (cytochrome)